MNEEELLPKWFAPAIKEKTIGSELTKWVGTFLIVLLTFGFILCFTSISDTLRGGQE